MIDYMLNLKSTDQELFQRSQKEKSEDLKL